MKPPKKVSVNVVTLGCAKNIVDSEHLLRQINNRFTIYHDANRFADIVIINTCGFINDAKQESLDAILQYAEAKKQGKIQQLIVMGCMAERYKAELKKEIPEVDAFFGVDSIAKIVGRLGTIYDHRLAYRRSLTTPKHYAYLKISEGCNRRCSFCAIPMIRGKHISVPEKSLLSEARSLADNGVRELILVAQDLSYYGKDIGNKPLLPRIIEKLSRIDGIEWIRLHYLYPQNFPMEIIAMMNSNPKLCPYLDIPFQHVSDKILNAMRRGINKEETLRLIANIHKYSHSITLRTSLIVGFPGEGKTEYQELKDFVREMQFDKLGVFCYSQEENTYAAKNYADKVAKSEKTRRADELMALQQEISLIKNRSKIGNTEKVIIDRKEGDFYIGRTRGDSPEIDGEVLIRSPKKLRTGHIYSVQISGADEYDLFANAGNL